MKKQINLFGHDFEFIVVEDEVFLGKYRAVVNYPEYPDHIAIDFGKTEEEAVENAVRKALASGSKESLKNLY